MPGRTEPRAPIRTCVGCRRRRPQTELVRLTRTGVGTLTVGRTLPGRGAWLCLDTPECLDLAVRRGGFARAFRTSIDAAGIDDLRADLGRSQERPGIDFVPGDLPARD